MATKTCTGSHASRTRATNPAHPPANAPLADHYYAGKVTVITLTRMGLTRSRRLRIVKAQS